MTSGQRSAIEMRLPDECRLDARSVRPRMTFVALALLSTGRSRYDLITSYLRWNSRGVRVASGSLVHACARIEPGARFFDGCRVEGRAIVGAFTYATAAVIANAQIGRFCSIGRGAIIGLNEHPLDGPSTHPYTYNAHQYDSDLKPAIVGHDVWIGAGAIIRSGVEVGSGAVVAAGAVVTIDVREHEVVGGVPARVISARSDTAKEFTLAVAAAETLGELRNIFYRRP